MSAQPAAGGHQRRDRSPGRRVRAAGRGAGGAAGGHRPWPGAGTDWFSSKTAVPSIGLLDTGTAND